MSKQDIIRNLSIFFLIEPVMLCSSLGFWAIQSPVADHPSGIGHRLPLRVYVLELFSPFKSIANYELFCKYV